MANNDPNFSSVKLLLHMDGANNGTSFPDVKGKTVTANGNVCTKTAIAKYGTASAYFDGSGDYLSLSASSDFDLSTGDFTIEFWVYAATGTYRVLGTRSGSPAIGWLVQVAVGTSVTWSQWTAGNTYNFATGGAPAANTLTHIAICRSGDNVKVFVSGVGGTALNSTNRPATNNVLNIGRDPSAPTTEQFAGYLDDVRITKGVARYSADFTPPTAAHPDYGRYLAGTITESTPHTDWTVRTHRLDTGALLNEVTATGSSYECPCSPGSVDYTGPVMVSCVQRTGGVWTASTLPLIDSYAIPSDPVATPYVYKCAQLVDPLYAYVVFLLNCNGTDGSTTFTDLLGHSVTASGNAQVDTAQSKFGGASALFDRVGDYLSVADSADWDLSGDFAIECWVRVPSAQPGASQTLWSLEGSDWTAYIRNSDGKIAFWAAAADRIASASAIAVDTWCHVAVTRSSGTVRLFIDGTVQATTYSSSASLTPTSVRIGAYGSTTYLGGWIDDFRITKDHARYTASFTPPTSELPSSKTGATEPTWPTTVGNTVTDGGATWTCHGRMVQPVIHGPLIPL